MLPSYYTDIYKKIISSATIDVNLNSPSNPPNINSIEYRLAPPNRSVNMYPIWESISINSKKHFVIGTSKGSGREWFSSLWGFERYDYPTNENNSAFRILITELITHIEYVADNLILVTCRNGSIDLWSTYTTNRDPSQPYCLFLVGRTYEHKAPIECLEIMGKKKAITGGEDFTLKIWDFGEEELKSSHTFRYAHNDSITGIAHSKTESSIFATCSRDKSVLLWDLRLVRPALALVSNYVCGFKGISWLESSKDNLLAVGDKTGSIHIIDKRTHKKTLSSDKITYNSIRKIACNGDKLAVIANTNKVKVFYVPERRIIYDNNDHTDFVRDVVWYNNLKLLSVGCDAQMRKHNITL